MEQLFQSQKQIYYYNSLKRYSVYEFYKSLQELIIKNRKKNQPIICVCIGSDRATGDCLGPIIGYKLSKIPTLGCTIYGTLEHPVHAQNLSETLQEIDSRFVNPFIIAVDASLGVSKHVGYITLGKGGLKPGIGVDKNLPPVGDIFITGIVNISGLLNQMLLQTTRLDIVMKLADFISLGLRYALYETKECYE